MRIISRTLHGSGFLLKANYEFLVSENKIWNMQPPPKKSQLTTIRIQRRVLQGRASGMDWTLNLIFGKSETSRDIKK